jgi:hypothetical protein
LEIPIALERRREAIRVLQLRGGPLQLSPKLAVPVCEAETAAAAMAHRGMVLPSIIFDQDREIAIVNRVEAFINENRGLSKRPPFHDF